MATAVTGLERYFEIIGGRATSRYLLSRSVPVEMPQDATLSELWDIHREAMDEYQARAYSEAPLSIAEPNLLDLKTRISAESLRSCCLCEHRCMVDRTEGRGRCGVGGPRIASHFVHLGEEEVLVPSYTIFFAGCNLRCVFCQNFDISTQPGAGREISAQDLSSWLRRASSGGARNINWVGGDPTPDIPFIMDVLRRTKVNIAQVWNSNMYMSEQAMSLLDGTMDIYLTDFKFGNDACALRLCDAPDYLRVVTRNHLMAASQGEVIVRHLVLPDHLECCTFPILDWLVDHMPSTPVNVMGQYHPEHNAHIFPELRRRPSPVEYRLAVKRALSKGLLLV